MEDTYLDAQYAIDYLQMLLVVCHSHTDAVNLQRLRGHMAQGDDGHRAGFFQP